MRLSSIQLDRAVGAVLASAAGDALGSQYEFGPSLADDVTPQFGEGVFGHAAGEWTDDTSMAIPMLDVLARGDLIDTTTREEIASRWIGWSRTAKDVGAQTRSVLSSVPKEFTEADIRDASRRLHERAGRSAGNGALMRTGPVALGYLTRPAEELADAARTLSELTHWEADSASACILWSAAIRHAILTGELDVHRQLALLPAADAARWRALIDETQGAHPREFMQSNGWVVRAFQGALAAVSGATSLVDAVERAVRGGGDTDTVAAIAGSLAGALWGGSAMPLSWKRRLHGWPGYAADDLVRQAVLAARGGKPDAEGWPSADRLAQPGHSTRGTLAQHPHDDGVWIGSLAALDRLPSEIDAVVSLCRIGTKQVPEDVLSIQVWLVDQPDRGANVDVVLAEAADAVAELRGEGRTVFLHCAEGRSRTAAVAALYGARHRGVALEQSWDDVSTALPGYAPQAPSRSRHPHSEQGVMMTTSPSANHQDPSLYCAYFGGPRDGFKTGDMPVALSGKKLTGMVSKIPLSQPAQYSLFAVYVCTSETQVEGFWVFEYRGMEGPNEEKLVARESTPKRAPMP